MKKYITKNNFVGIVVFFTFILLTLIIGKRHEPWADEAQSWLIARDSSFTEIIFERVRYEGTPCLWHFILKIFISLGLTYKYFYIVPIIFSVLGVFILEFKLKLPMYVKIMLPFTYYIFYQYTIVARSYCLIFPAFCFILAYYEERISKPNMFCLSILILSSICLHTLLLSGFLFILYVYDYMEYFRNNRNKKTLYINIICSIIMCIFFSFTVSYVLPPSDVSFISYCKKSLLEILANSIVVISKALISSNYNIFSYLLSFEIFIVLILLINNKSKTILLFCFIFVPIVLFLSIYYFNEWHIGIVFLSIFFALTIIYCSENKILNNRKIVLNILIIYVLAVQIIWSVLSAAYDYTENYSAAYETALFIKKNNYENKSIYGLGYSVTAIQPYFEKNVFNNYKSNESYYFWSSNNNYMTNQEITEILPEIVIVADLYKDDFNDIIEKLENSGYKSIKFKGNTYVKSKMYESESYVVYINK